MRVAILSDLHANFEAARALEPHLAEVDQVLCLGDILGYYTQVNEIMDWVREHVDICVLGNHDAFILAGCPANLPPAVTFGVEHAVQTLEDDHAQWLRQVPLSWGGVIGGERLLLCHGSPWKPLADYLYADNERLNDLHEFDYELIAFGQTHRFFQRQTETQLVLNPGAVGQSRDQDTLGMATAAIVDLRSRGVERLIEPYNYSKVLTLARRHGAGDWVDKHMPG